MVKHGQRAATRGGDSRWPLLIVMCAGYFLVLLDVTIVNVALPKIGAGLGSSCSGCSGWSTGTRSPSPA